MPTPSERHALLFLAGLLFLGAGVRAHRTFREHPDPDPAARLALKRQLAAVDSARAAPPAPKPKKPRARAPRAPRAPEAPSPAEQRRSSAAPQPPPPARAPIDLDVASASEIERLPRIGPRLAARIVANRDTLGPFGSLQEFQRVRGVGPVMAKTVAPHVTFSLAPRPSPVTEGAYAVESKARAPRRRARATHPQ